MKALQFIEYLQSLDVRIWAEEGKLRCNAPPGVLNEDLRTELTRLKPELISLLQNVRGANGQTPIAPIQRRDGDLELSFSQQRLWLLAQLDPASPAYNIPASLMLRGRLDIPTLEKALSEIVRRHEILRTSFADRDGRPVQRIAPMQPIDLKLHDLRSAPSDRRESMAQDIISTDSNTPFDIATAPLFRFHLFALEPETHIFHLNIHHIVFDGWSVGVFTGELGALYTAFASGQSHALPGLDIQYADFAQWQRDYLKDETLDRQIAYWKTKLGGQLPALQLPTDHPRPAVQTFHGGRQIVQLSRELSGALNQLSRREGVSLFMTLLTVFKALLHRQTGQTDILVGTPIAGRNRVEIESLIGFFINTLVMRTDLSGAPTFRELLARVKDTALEAYAHQDTPFEKLVEVLDPERDLSRTPLFQVFFNHVNLQLPSLELPGLQIEAFGNVELESKFDLTLYVGESEGRIGLMAVYNAGLFTATRIEDLLAQYTTLIEACAADLDTPIATPVLVSSALRPQLPDPSAPLDFYRGGTILSHFSRVAQQFPDNIALIGEYGKWSYRELDALTDQLANLLIHRGIQREDVVAVYTYRSAALVKALLGVLKAGASFVILDQSYPPQRLVSMIEQAKPAGMIGIETMGLIPADLEAALAPHLKCKIELSEEHGLLDRYRDELSTDRPNVVVDPDQLAYLSFTSGSTGQPKGILGAHRPVAHFLDWYIAEFDLKPTDRFGLLSGIAHDPLLRDIFAPLSVGATLCVPPQLEFELPDNLLRWMKHEAITVAHLTPALSSLMMQGFTRFDSARPPRDAAPLPALRLVCFGGDALDRKDIENIARLSHNAECVNFYGATETPQAMGFHRCNVTEAAAASTASPRIPLGRGIADVQLLVLNQVGQLAGLGEIGEICIRTPYLAKGYLGDDALTTRRFVLNPFTNAPGDLIYRTGDAGRYQADGVVQFAGRLDDQVSINGYRVELNEIRSVLNTHPEIHDSAVVALVDSAGHCSLVAYFVAEPGFKLEIADLSEYLRKSLPVYMIPGMFVRIDAIPLTPNGKLDRQALPDPDQALGRLRKAYVAPRNETEKALAEIWSAVLRKEPISVRDNFFDLGGHSLIATQVVSRIRNQLNIEIPLRAMFEEPTIAQLAHAIDTGHGSHSRPKAPPIVPMQRSGTDPLSYSQERMWFIQQLQPDTIAYNMSTAIHLFGPFDAKLMIEAFRRLALRQESFRTWFDSIDGQPYQRVEDEPRIAGQVIDMQALPESQREPDAIRQAGEILQTPFDLRNDPLVKVVIFKLAPEHHILLICKHHIVSDLWSYGILGRELNEIYMALRQNREPSLPEMPVQYVDYSHWQRNWLRESVLEDQLDYWRNQLQGVGVLELPTDFTRPVSRTFRGARRLVRFPADWVIRIRNFSTQNNVTPFMTLLSIFKLVLWRYTGSDDVAVGTPIANRHRIEVENLIGTFVNTVAIRSDLSGNPTYREFLGRIRENALGAFANQDLPFERIVEEMAPVRDLSIPPLVQVLFNLGNAPINADNDREFSIRPVMIDRGAAQFDMTMAVMLSEEQGGGIFIEYDTELFAADTIERLLRHYQNALESALANPDTPIADLAFLNETEVRRLTVEWNATDADYPRDTAYHRLFERQAAATPGSVAVRFNGDTITYRDLNRRANQVAHYLRAQGVQPDQFVGVYFERSIEMLVALLGIMKSGAAYLPLDPAFPKDRLEYMIEDSAAPVILSTESLRGEIDTQSATLICIDADWPKIAECPDTNPDPAAGPENIAYIIYTSGSTGKPKGVVIPNRALVNFLNSMAREPGLAAGDILLAVTTLSFDISGLELFLPLMTGATIVLADRETSIDAARLMQTLQSSGGNVMQATPATWRMMLEAGWQGDPNLKILCGGEALTLELAHKLQPICRELWNMYGPTETTIWSTIWKVEPAADSIIIGRPIDNTTIYILDPNLRPVPIGVAGELHIGGDGLAVGYLNRPELTAEKFIPDPFAPSSAQRIYKTGDMARWRPDGQIECLGRVDFQVKIRGFRIEVGEVETVLSKFSGIQKAVVVAGDDAAGVKRLVAYYTTGGAADPSVAGLRDFMRKSLPDYMIPSVFVKLDSFPLTPNGKVDRKRLPDPGKGDLSSQADYVAPHNELEAHIAEIYAEVLGLDKVSVTADFFELGGHSLAATRLIARLRTRFEIDLPLRSIFQESSVAGLAASLKKDDPQSGYQYASRKSIPDTLIPMQVTGAKRPLFLVAGAYADEERFLRYLSNMIPHLGVDQPVFGFQPRGLDGKAEPHQTVEEMAAYYIEQLLELQPEGPYFICGECVGGIVAFEIARQLTRQGRKVAALILMDTHKPTPQLVTRYKSYLLYQKMLKNLRRVGSLFTEPVKTLQQWAGAFRRIRADRLPMTDQERIQQRISGIEKNYRNVLFNYRPRQYDGKLTLIVNEVQYKIDPSIGWSELAEGGLEILVAPGNHATRLTQFGRETATLLGGVLDREEKEIDSPQ